MSHFDENGFDYGEVEGIKETLKALLVDDGTQEFWVPKSQIHESSEVNTDTDAGMLIVSAWFAREKGWLV